MLSFFLDMIVMDVKCFPFFIRDCHGCNMISFSRDMISMNEIMENNYDVNVLWKGNIAYLFVLENDYPSTIADDSNFS
jgi:hypothetical protein